MVNAGAILVLSLLLNLSEVDMSLAEKFDWVMNYFKVSPDPFSMQNENCLEPVFVHCVWYCRENCRLHGMSVDDLLRASFFLSRRVLLVSSYTNYLVLSYSFHVIHFATISFSVLTCYSRLIHVLCIYLLVA